MNPEYYQTESMIEKPYKINKLIKQENENLDNKQISISNVKINIDLNFKVKGIDDRLLKDLYTKTISRKNWNWKYNLYHLSEIFGVTKNCVITHLKKLGLFKWRTTLIGNPRNELICNYYIKKNLSTIRIATRTGISQVWISKLLNKWNIKTRDKGYKTVAEEVRHKLMTGEEVSKWVKYLYTKKEWECNTIATALNIDRHSVYNRLERARIPRTKKFKKYDRQPSKTLTNNKYFFTNKENALFKKLYTQTHPEYKPDNKIITGIKFCKTCNEKYIYFKKPIVCGKSSICMNCSASFKYKKTYVRLTKEYETQKINGVEEIKLK